MRAEFTALRDRVRAHPKLANKTDTVIRFNADGSAVRTNYVVCFPSIPDLDDARYTARQTLESTRLCRWDVRVVAVDADGVLLLAEAVQEQLIGHVLAVSGRNLDPLRFLAGVEENQVQYDRTAQLFYVDMTFETTSRKA